MLYNWAAENPDNVRCILGIYPVCDLRSYPGLGNAAGAFALTPAALQQQLEQHNPIDRLAPLARAGVAILHIHGDADSVVPLEKNSQVVLDRYAALGGAMKLIVVPGKGHAEIPEYFQDARLVQFLADGNFANAGGWHDTQLIEPQAKAGISAAVVVADAVPLVHTRQIYAEGLDAKAVQAASGRLQKALQNADASLEHIIKLNFIMTGDGQQSALAEELAGPSAAPGRR